VIAIIGILVALLLPAVQSARESARRVQCANKLRQLALGLHNFHFTYEKFPPGGITKLETCSSPTAPLVGGNTDAGPPWSVFLLPYLEQQNRYEQYDMEGSFAPTPLADETDNVDMQFKPNPAFECPSDPRNGSGEPNSNYYACMGGGDSSQQACEASCCPCRKVFTNGIFYNNSATPMGAIRDGTSNTAMIVETRYLMMKHERASLPPPQDENYFSWDSSLRPYPSGTHAFQSGLVALHEPMNIHDAASWCAANNGGSSYHPGGCHFAMADASVHFVADSIDMDVYFAIGTRSDGLPIGGFQP